MGDKIYRAVVINELWYGEYHKEVLEIKNPCGELLKNMEITGGWELVNNGN